MTHNVGTRTSVWRRFEKLNEEENGRERNDEINRRRWNICIRRGYLAIISLSSSTATTSLRIVVESKYETASHVSHNFLPDDSILSRAPSSPSHLIPPIPLVKFNDLAAESRENSMNFTRHKMMQKLAGLSHFTPHHPTFQ